MKRSGIRGLFARWRDQAARRLRPVPEVALRQVTFRLEPHIIRRQGRHLLRYQVAVPADGLGLRRVLFARKTPQRGYYFFGLPVSRPEDGRIQERLLSLDDLEDHAEDNAIYWLDPDGTETHLDVGGEMPQDAPQT